jgi:hypothetical protein
MCVIRINRTYNCTIFIAHNAIYEPFIDRLFYWKSESDPNKCLS